MSSGVYSLWIGEIFVQHPSLKQMSWLPELFFGWLDRAPWAPNEVTVFHTAAKGRLMLHSFHWPVSYLNEICSFYAFTLTQKVLNYTSNRIVWNSCRIVINILTSRGHLSLSSESLNRSEHFPTPSCPTCVACSLANMLYSMSTDKFLVFPSLSLPTKSLFYKQRCRNKQRPRHRPRILRIHLRR